MALYGPRNLAENFIDELVEGSLNLANM